MQVFTIMLSQFVQIKQLDVCLGEKNNGNTKQSHYVNVEIPLVTFE